MGTFKERELAGWHSKAGAYDDYFGRITPQIVDALLDAAAVGRGTRVLDVACGPGYVAAAAQEWGALAIGIDFAPGMVEEAKRKFPHADVRLGDAEALAFADGSFDAVVCGFGIGHLPEPDKAIAEAYRVLRPGGRYALTWWCTPDRHEFYRLVYGSVKVYGNPDVPLPPAPPVTRFSDPAECTRALRAAGFIDLRAEERTLAYDIEKPQQALDLVYKAAVRMAMLLEMQTQPALERIHKSILDGVEAHRVEGGYRIGWPAVIASGRKPD